LNGLGTPPETRAVVEKRAQALKDAGLGAFDAYHLAWAEHLEVDRFVTCDDGILATARRQPDIIRVDVVDPVALSGELEQWK
jgi:hypothetical protein